MYKFCKGHMHRGVPNHAKPYILQGSPSGISSTCAYVTKSASWNYVKSFLVCKGRPLPSHWKGYIFQESMGLLVGLLVGLHFQKGDAFVEFVNGYKSSKLFRSNTFLHITLLILRASECFPMDPTNTATPDSSTSQLECRQKTAARWETAKDRHDRHDRHENRHEINEK